MHCGLQSYLLIFSFDSWLKYGGGVILVFIWFGGFCFLGLFVCFGWVFLWWGGLRNGFCEKLPETSLTPGKVNSIWLQDRSATVQGSTYKQQWYSLWDNIFRKQREKMEEQMHLERVVRMCESEVVCSWLNPSCLPKSICHCPPQLDKREKI